MVASVDAAAGTPSAKTIAALLKAGGKDAEAMVTSFLGHALEVAEASVSKQGKQPRK
jgi:hypothetical protein